MPWRTDTLMNQRAEFAMKSLATDNFRALCREYGISPKVGCKWRGRFVAEGLAGLRDLSRRPNQSPQALSEEESSGQHPQWIDQRVYLRRHVREPGRGEPASLCLSRPGGEPHYLLQKGNHV